MAPCDAKDRIRQLEAEVARLRELLQEIADKDLEAEKELGILGLDLPEMSEVRKKIVATLALPQQNKETGNG